MFGVRSADWVSIRDVLAPGFPARPTYWLVGALLALLTLATPAFAQHEHHAAPPSDGWSWKLETQAFLNANIQQRRFRDFRVVESQNWLMLAGSRKVGRGRLDLNAMLSFEPWTVRKLGSPQVFQTGETYQGSALVDYQHPHDFVMEASARFEWPVSSRWRLHLEGGPVAAPALGPPVFMHRASAALNPTAPLGHHNLDSRHITHGVVTAGVTRGPFTFEASGFYGREPDEDRVAIDFGPIDSYAARIWFRRGRWQAQISGGHLTQPDRTEFADHDLLTASVSFTGELAGRPLVVTGAVGYTSEVGTGRRTPASLLEGVWHATPRNSLYMRGEFLVKDVLTRGSFHPPGFTHPHILSTIGALTVGYERRLATTGAGEFGAGADATVYYRDVNLYDGYGDPLSVHFFLRYRFGTR